MSAGDWGVDGSGGAGRGGELMGLGCEIAGVTAGSWIWALELWLLGLRRGVGGRGPRCGILLVWASLAVGLV